MARIKTKKKGNVLNVDDIRKMVNELVKGKTYQSKVYELYEKNRKKLVELVKDTRITVFYGDKKKAVFTKEKRTILDQKKLEAHFGGVIPDKFYTDTPVWTCTIESID